MLAELVDLYFCISSFFHFSFASQIDLNDELVVFGIMRNIAESFFLECKPFLQSSSSSLFIEECPSIAQAASSETVNHSHSVKDFCNWNAVDVSSVKVSFIRLLNSFDLVVSNKLKEKVFIASAAPAAIKFQVVTGSPLIASQQTSNYVQILFSRPSVAMVTAAGKAARRICSYPISLTSFYVKVCAKDLASLDTACVELLLFTQGSDISSRFCHVHVAFMCFSLCYSFLRRSVMIVAGHRHFSCFPAVLFYTMDQSLVTYRTSPASCQSLFAWSKQE
jgi:hypothetical protein